MSDDEILKGLRYILVYEDYNTVSLADRIGISRQDLLRFLEEQDKPSEKIRKFVHNYSMFKKLG